MPQHNLPLEIINNLVLEERMALKECILFVKLSQFGFLLTLINQTLFKIKKTLIIYFIKANSISLINFLLDGLVIEE